MSSQLEAKRPSHVKVATASLIGTAIRVVRLFSLRNGCRVDFQQAVLSSSLRFTPCLCF